MNILINGRIYTPGPQVLPISPNKQSRVVTDWMKLAFQGLQRW